MLWTIRRKLSAISLLAVLFLLAVGGTGIVGAQSASAAANRQRDLSAAVTYQLEGLNAELGVRGDNFEAIAVVHVADVQAVIAEFNDFAAQWRSAQASVASSKLPAALLPAAKELQT
ncbi:MAG: hypothetical protein QOJ83_2173, partial [Frankiales bacterium]|nr:hypothetical protein [Frankiales bacterium]